MSVFKNLIFIILGFHLFLSGQQTNGLIKQYSDSLDAFEKTAYESDNKNLVEYLRESREFVEAFKKEKNDGRLMNYNIKQRILLRNNILSSATMEEKIILSKEQDLYDALTHQLHQEDLIYRLKARSILADRKYYERNEDEKGTIIELYLNGVFSFTATDLYDLNSATYGIKPWEINARLETIGVIDNKEITGILFTMGVLYNIFPEINQQGADPEVRETFLSEYIRRSGLKFGVGGRFEQNFNLQSGIGWQLRVFSLWGLYSFHKKEMFFAVGINDLSWIKLFLPQIN
jgi:hypothetical protein